jgi:hypothetical protein
MTAYATVAISIYVDRTTKEGHTNEERLGTFYRSYRPHVQDTILYNGKRYWVYRIEIPADGTGQGVIYAFCKEG